MKLIKINTDHYVVVDDSEIREGDWYLTEIPHSIWKYDKSKGMSSSRGWNKKITHSTQPLYKNDFWAIRELRLSEVKELIGEVDVEKKASKYTSDQKHSGWWAYLRGYNQALEDNKEKKYTRNEAHALMCKAFIQGWKKADVVEAGLEGLETDIECAWILTTHDSTPEKTEWEVEFDENGKLKLK